MLSRDAFKDVATKRRRVVSVGVYGVIAALPGLVRALLVVLYTSVFTLRQYGTFGVLTVMIGLLAIVLELGIPQAILRNYYDWSHHRGSAHRYLASALLSSNTISFVMVPILFVVLFLTWPLIKVVTSHIPYYIAAILLAAFFERTASTGAAALRAMERPFYYAVGPILEAAVTLAVAVVLVIVIRWGLAGAVTAMVAGRMASAMAYSFILYVRLGIRGGHFDKEITRSSLSFGLPLVPNRLAAWSREAALRPILVHVVTLPAVGLFTLASSLSGFPILLSSAVEMVLSPYYFKMRTARSEGFTERVHDFGVIFLAVLAPVWAGMILFAPEAIRTFAGATYEGAIPICGILLCASFVRSQQAFIVRQVHFLRQTWMMPLVTIPCAGISIGLAVFLTAFYGIADAGWAVLAADVALFAGLARLTRGHERLHHPVTMTLAITAGLTLLAIWSTWISVPEIGWSATAAKLAVLAAVTAGCTGAWIWPRRAFIRAILNG